MCPSGVTILRGPSRKSRNGLPHPSGSGTPGLGSALSRCASGVAGNGLPFGIGDAIPLPKTDSKREGVPMSDDDKLIGEDKLAAEEARRAGQHGAVKSFVEREVGAEVAAEASIPTTTEIRREERVAAELRRKALDDVVVTERAVEQARGAARVSQMVDYVFYVIYALLAVRIGLALMAGNPEAGFYRFIRAVTAPLYAPFRAIVAYALLHLASNGILRLVARRKIEI